MFQLLKMSNEKGFSLIESIFQLLIFAAFLQLLILFFYWKIPIEQQYSTSHAGWEMFVADVQDELADVRRIELQKNGQGIQFITERGRINLEHRQNVIRKTVDGAGHVPFLTAVSKAQFTLEGTQLVISATLVDGTRKERDFKVGIYPE